MGMMPMFEGSFGKGFGMGFGKDKGKGKGKFAEKSIRDHKPECKVWIGDLADGTTWKILQEHMNAAGKAVWTEVYRGKSKGSGAVAYTNAEDAATAISMLNGSELEGAKIIVDAWEEKPKKEEAGN